MTVEVENRKNVLEYGVVLMKHFNYVDKTLLDIQMLLLHIFSIECPTREGVKDDIQDIWKFRIVLAQNQGIVLKEFEN